MKNWATAHHARVTNEMRKNSFSKSIDFMFRGVTWAPRSPDLTSLDFFLRRFLKGKVYINRPCDLDELKENIIQEIRNLTPDT